MAEEQVQTVGQTSFFQALVIQLRVIGALLMREIITRYGRDGLGFLWIFIEPMMFTLGITALWALTGVHHGSADIPITEFAATGYSTVLMWRNGGFRCGKAIEVNLALLYHRNVRVFDIIASRVILEIAGASVALIVIVLTFIGTGLMRPPEDLLTMVYAWLLLSWLTWDIGFFVGALSERWESFDRLWHVFCYLLFPLSGAIFMVDWLPTWAQKWILWLPTVHCTEMLRHGYWGEAVRTYEDPAYMALFNLALLFIVLALVKETGRRAEPE